MSIKKPLTPAGIEPATFRFVAQHLNHCATAVPISGTKTENIYFKIKIISYAKRLNSVFLSIGTARPTLRTEHSWCKRKKPEIERLYSPLYIFSPWNKGATSKQRNKYTVPRRIKQEIHNVVTRTVSYSMVKADQGLANGSIAVGA